MATLESWLKECKLSKLLDKLTENDVESLEDLQSLENQQEIQDLAVEMELKTIKKKKFVTAVMKLNNITPGSVTQPGAQSASQQSQNGGHKEMKQNDDEKEMKQPEGPQRKVYNLKGVHPVKKLKSLQVNKRHRTIMVIGATGTGKTT
eukprot:CAMPEP_0201563858 /NCGR_PEP_ID=MMETSP0190_2-20130828/1384_1 /ASSEMBLY_ACC=CAM_ASM_000263 /TAXON_ID=37353 /ORGANISM="Rosalina sp." /LENGTH=147 /DNA_ID=CAMNT_0047979191 /DNA_START=70 /DNA_END=509 /DNA_ORIENTATION=+